MKTTLAVLVALAALGGVGLWLADRTLPSHLRLPASVGCTVAGNDLDLTQMANAATIAAVGIRKKVPDRAVTVALAAAMQESKLENLDGGDRDSVGLFQQRPSQGWGTEEQLRNPRYATTKFYSALLRVKGWDQMTITQAAQKVQRSAYPGAYEKWADQADAIAGALLGRSAKAVSCTLAGGPTVHGTAAVSALTESIALDFGVTLDSDAIVQAAASSGASTLTVLLPVATTQRGWQYAHWLVSYAAEQGIESVTFAGQQWSAETGNWTALADGRADGVLVQLAA